MRRQVGLAAAAWLAPAAFAMSLGDIEVRSRLGEPLDARIPVTVVRGEAPLARCFRVIADKPGALPRIAAPNVELRRSRRATFLHLRSQAPLEEPAMALAVALECDGQAAQRDYDVLLDPPQGGLRAAPPIATLDAQAGDTLASVAKTIYPRDAAVRRSYLAALRSANPALATLGDGDSIGPGAAIALPDLRPFAGVATGPRESTAAPARRTEIAAAPAAASIASPSPSASAPASSAPAPARAAHDEFRLKLSGPDLDLSRSRAIDDRTRAGLRERLVLLDADDETAALLSLRHRVQQLEARLTEVQLKLTRETSVAEGRVAATDVAPAMQAPQPAQPLPVAQPAPVAQSVPAVAQSAAVAAPPVPAVAHPAVRVVPNPAPEGASWRDGPGLLAALIAGVLLAGALLAAWARNRGQADPGSDAEAWPETVMDVGAPVAAPTRRTEDEGPIEIALPPPGAASAAHHPQTA